MTKRLVLTSLLLATLLVLAGCASLRPVVIDDVRYIPVELWTGADWDGTRELRMRPVEITSGRNENRIISGPMPWRHPKTGAAMTVYERVKEKTGGTKRQLYAINDDGTGLGRVYDSRPGQEDRYFSGEVIFPLGPWSRGEERVFRYLEYTDEGPIERIATLKIRRLDFNHGGVPHSLKYDWKLHDASGELLFHERYVYSPGRGLVMFRDRME